LTAVAAGSAAGAKPYNFFQFRHRLIERARFGRGGSATAAELDILRLEPRRYRSIDLPAPIWAFNGSLTTAELADDW
jgi:hypothetical protein